MMEESLKFDTALALLTSISTQSFAYPSPGVASYLRVTAVMTLLGEPPIWSYFKPKATTSSAPPLKKRKVGHSEPKSTGDPQLQVGGSGRRGKEHDFFKKTTNTPESNSRASSIFQTAQAQKSPNPPSLRKRKGKDAQTHLQTPPTTCGGTSRRHENTLSSLNASPNSSKVHEAAANKQTTPFLPTPVTLAPHPRSIPNSRDSETPSKSAGSHQPSAIVDSALENSQFIPSSQTQPELVFIGPDPLTDASGLGKGALTVKLSLHTAKHFKTQASVDDDDGPSIIQSSQSQPPLRIPGDYQQSPIVNNRADSYRHESDLLFPESIPSSQSQEIELSIPEFRKYDSSGSDRKIPSARPFGRYMNLNVAANPYLQRTFSDEIFPIRLHHSLLSDIFQEEDQNNSQPGPPIPKRNEGDVEDSVTESESEDDEKQLNAFRLVPRPSMSGNPRSLPRQVTPPLQESAYDASQEDASQGNEEGPQGYEDDLPILQPTLGSPGSSFESLPADLREIFGNNDDSYPPDFPMSLR